MSEILASGRHDGHRRAEQTRMLLNMCQDRLRAKKDSCSVLVLPQLVSNEVILVNKMLLMRPLTRRCWRIMLNLKNHLNATQLFFCLFVSVHHYTCTFAGFLR